jgi:hypothetical protein
VYLYVNERKKEKKKTKGLIELIPNGFAVSRRCTRPAFIHIQRLVGLCEGVVALGRGGSDDGAKHFEVDHDRHNFAAATRFHQLFIDRLIAPAFFERIIIVAGHLQTRRFYILLC